MTTGKPQKTAADLMVIALSPALIMTLVGSLCFFLIDVFYRGLMAGLVRWVMFWFVVAIVLVSRIAIEKTSEYAALYGLALAAAVWLYLARTQPGWLLGVPLLAMVWFCAHKLVCDCTLIDDEEDASGQGLLQHRPVVGTPRCGVRSAQRADPTTPIPKAKPKRKRPAPVSPGLWVVYFSLAALPLFGIGQALLPADDADSRRMGMIYVVLYMGAALGLLITTSFLGLRRYLRQRYLRMPPSVAFSWLKLGGGVSLAILLSALFLPRPGANQAWTALRYQIDYRLHQASQYAAKSNPPGQDQGRAGNQTGGKQGETKTTSQKPASQPATTSPPSAPPPPLSLPKSQAASLYQFLRAAFLIVAALAAAWLLFRCRFLLLEIARSLNAAIVDFFRKFLNMMPARRIKPTSPEFPKATQRPLAEYKNPFYAGQDHIRPPAEIILYTYDAVRAWAAQQGMELHPDETAREFCQKMAEHSPDMAAPYRHLSFLYAHAAYGLNLPSPCDLEPLKELWRHLTWPHETS